MNQKSTPEEPKTSAAVRRQTATSKQSNDTGGCDFADLSMEGHWCYKVAPPLPTDISNRRQIEWMLAHARLEACNNTYARMVGASSAKAIIGKRFVDLMDGPSARAFIQAWIAGEYRFSATETRQLTKSGGATWYLVNAGSRLEKECVTMIRGVQIDITPRKQAQAALHDSEERFNAFLNNSPVGLAIFDSRYRYVFINDVLQKINGPSKQAHIGKSVQEVLPKAAPIIIPIFKKIFSTGEPALNMELSGEVPSRPGMMSHYLVSYFPIAIAQQSPEFIGAVVVDITNRKLAEQALDISNGRYQKLFHQSPVALWEEDFTEVVDHIRELKEDGVTDLRAFLEDNPSQLRVLAQKIKILNVNQAAIDLHKAQSRQELLGNLEKLFTEKSMAVFREEILAIADGRLEYETEGEVKTLDGDPIQVFLSLSVDTEQTTPARAILATVDITARKQAHEKIRRSEERLKRAQEAGKVGVWEIDLNTRQATFSELLARIHGVDERTYDLESIIDWVPPEDRPTINNALARALEPEGEYNIEHRIIHQQTGQLRWVRARGSVTHQVEGESHRLSGTTQDITKRKLVEQERDKLQKRINQIQRMESIGNLAGGIAHDFNNILSSIIGFTELALEDADKGTLLEDNLLEVYTAGKRAKDLVKQILAFARQSDEEKKPIQVSTIAAEVLKLLRSTIPASIDIRHRIDTESYILGNTTQIHQIFMNMCTNAAQAMEETGGVLEVSAEDVVIGHSSPYPLSNLDPGEYMNIVVSDTGKGIPPEIIDSIFEPYYTSKAVGEGTGLGLAVVSGIVESYGGQITAESQPGIGSVFNIYLPIASRRRSAQKMETEQTPAGRERILFIDDEAPIARMGGQILERLGYAVTTRTSSIEALELFQSRPRDFDLVISDMTMPNMTGDELAVELMAIRPDIPVIICTGYSKKMSEQLARRIGIKAFAYKPMVKTELAKTIRRVLDQAQGSTSG